MPQSCGPVHFPGGAPSFFSFFMVLLFCVSTERSRAGYVICRAPVTSEDAVQKLVRISIWKGQSTETSNAMPLEPAVVGSPRFFWEELSVLMIMPLRRKKSPTGLSPLLLFILCISFLKTFFLSNL